MAEIIPGTGATEEKPPLIVIKKIKKVSGGHHGGAWKIAYADFVTAMMAFFLLMWLVSSVNKSKLEGIAEYFKQPLKILNKGGDNLAEITPKTVLQPKIDTTEREKEKEKNALPSKPDTKTMDDVRKQKELEHLQKMKGAIENMINSTPEVSKYKDQIKVDITYEGLRIQVIDNEERPMFAMSSDELEPEIRPVLRSLAPLFMQIPNKISIIGHTDGFEYNSEDVRKSNWDLSSNRANSARRELEAAGMPKDKILRVMGYGASILLDARNPHNPKNRRISIVVMKDAVTTEVIDQNK